MCSLEDAWGKDYMITYADIPGTKVDGKNVASQGLLHDAYNKTPDNLFQRGQMSHKGTPPVAYMQPGAHVKSRVNSPNINTPNGSISAVTNDLSQFPNANMSPAYLAYPGSNIEASMDPLNRNMSISGSAYDSAFMEGDTVKHFMAAGINTNPVLSQQRANFSNMLNNTNRMNTYVKRSDDNSECSNINDDLLAQQIASAQQINMMLEQILSRIEGLESKMLQNSNKNINDMILYTVFGILLAIVIYAIIAGISGRK